MLRKPIITSTEVQLHSDVSVSWGSETVHVDASMPPSIPALGVCIVLCNCYNEAIVSMENSGACKDKQLAHLI